MPAAKNGKLHCPTCEKKVDVEALDLEIESDFTTDNGEALFEGTIRLVNACEECGEELRQATLC